MRILRILLAVLALCGLAAADSASLMPVPKIQFLDTNGVPVAGGFVFTYQAGTTTPLVTYTDASGATPNTDPVVLDSGGFANIWLGANTYKIVLQDRTGVQIWSVDNVSNPGQIESACANTPNCFVKLDANGFVPQSVLNYVQGATGSVNRTIQNKLQDTVSVKDFGAKGDGSTDDTTDLQNAFNYAISAGKALYFPSGTYLTSAMLTAYTGASGTITIYGESNYKSILYCKNCAAAQEAVLRVASDASASAFTSGINIHDLTIWGTTNTTYALELNNPAGGYIARVAPGPAVSACLYVSGGVGMTYDSIVIDSNHTNGWVGGMHPAAGWILDRSSLAQSTTSTLITPTIQGMNSGTDVGLYLKDTQHIVVTGMQLSENDINLDIGAASLNDFIIGGLSEQLSGNGDAIIDGAGNSFSSIQFSGPVEVNNMNVFSENQFARTVTVNKNASQVGGAVFTNSRVQSSAIFVDNSGVSTFSGTRLYSEGEQLIYNFPATQELIQIPQSQVNLGPAYSPVVMNGTWTVSTAAAPVAISTRTFTVGKSWKMLLVGSTIGTGSPILNGGATVVELNETSNVLNLSSSRSVTFSVNSSGFLQMAESADGGPFGFSGQIIFMPSEFSPGTAGSLSASYAGVAKSTGVQLTSATEPTCNAANAGLFWYIQGNSTTKDDAQICDHNAVNVYSWASIILGQQALPTITAGSGAGTSPTISVEAYSTSYSGTIDLTTGTSPAATATIATITFASALNKVAGCVITPSVTAAIDRPIGIANDSTTKFDLKSGTAALAASTVYQWNYVCL